MGPSFFEAYVRTMRPYSFLAFSYLAILAINRIYK